MHEQSITFPIRSGPLKDKWVNVPGIYNGQEIDEDIGHTLFLQGKLKPLGGYYNTVQEAEKAAISRSKMFDKDDNLLFPNGAIADIVKTFHWPYR
jgi:hypothetical protein